MFESERENDQKFGDMHKYVCEKIYKNINDTEQRESF